MLHKFDKQGFTLIEVIVGIILAALLGTMIVQYTGTNLQATVESLVATKNNSEAVSVMEEITRDYRNWLENNPGAALSEFRTDLENNYTGAQTQMITLRPEDPAESILRVTVSRGDRKLVSLFTK
ncbi:MAG: prepilin-type N-terminal cleavage/methylation domain-containing protein [Desulfobacteraceae bacterium]|nr:prepilin-type N-terminal cleavage/methylation domain-containing protein [Desulfobacteraceae bacterium]MCF8035632.1 prepilin-type N-terminal cleavage/methylation domain-containing protein [Desulfobacteraceae bacterium]